MCPTCWAPLAPRESAYACAPCAASYPILDGAIAVLLHDATSAIAEARVLLEAVLRAERDRIAGLSRLIEDEPAHARAELQSWLVGRRGNVQWLEAIAATLDRAVDRTDLLAAGRDDVMAIDRDRASTIVRRLVGYVRRDWSGWPLCEDEIARAMRAVHAQLDERGVSRGGPVLVLGAGAGRFAVELASRFDVVRAIDRSLSMACAFARVRDGADDQVFDVHDRNVRSSEDLARPMVPRVPDGLRTDAMSYAVADARDMPFATASFAAVVSIYFTDVVPLAEVLPELRRVIAPGGCFVHLGPLGYHFDEPEEMRTTDQVREAFADAGFDVRSESWTRGAHCLAPGSMETQVFDEWCFAAARDALTDEMTADTIPSLGAGIRVETATKLDDRDETLIEARVRSRSGRWLDVGQWALALLRAIDGETPLGALIAAILRDAPEASRPSERELVAMAQKLLRRRIVRGR